MVLVDGKGLPMGVRLESASPSEVKLAEATVAEVRVPRPKQAAEKGIGSGPKCQGTTSVVPLKLSK